MVKSVGSSIVSKCAAVMDVVANAKKPPVFSEIAAETGFVKSSCHRVLAVLVGEGLVEYETATRTYRTGPRLHAWARWAWRRIDLQQIAGDAITELSERRQVNVALSVMDEDAILYLRTVDYVPLRYASRAGDRAPLHCTAAGKVFLAHITEAKRSVVLSNLKLEKLTEKTITSLPELMNELPGIVSRGYAGVIGEEALQVAGIAAPIFDENGEITACLSLWNLIETDESNPLGQHVDALKASANEISRIIGWRSEAR